MNTKEQGLIWAYPLLMLLIQLAGPAAAPIAAVLLFLCAGLIPALRKILILFGATAAGYYIWVCCGYLLNELGIEGNMAVIAGRFGLLGYLIIFFVWNKITPQKENYFGFGNPSAKIRFPLIWRGKSEVMWRFILIFSGICLVPVIALALNKNISYELIVMALIFTLINASLEELLWRGQILPRLIGIAGERQGLIISALTFGLYHISLGFPLWACLVFAIGGFYMGGSAVISKGLLAPWIMHLMVNLIFVFAGLIF